MPVSLFVANVLADLRFALRTLRKSPLFVAVAVLSLALGIGANTAIFTLVDQLILRLLPVKHPEQLVLLWGRGSHYGGNSGPFHLSYPMYADFRDKNQVFDGMCASWDTAINLNFEGHTERIEGELVTGSYFPVLGVGPALGAVADVGLAGLTVWLARRTFGNAAPSDRSVGNRGDSG